MPELLRWLLGLQKSPDWVSGGSWSVRFQSLPQGGWALAAVALALLAVVGVWWLYRKEGRNLPVAARLLLAGLRLAIVGCVTAMLLELVLVITKEESIPSRLLVLVDTSESMGLTDPYADESVAADVAARVGLKTGADQPDVAALRMESRLRLAQRSLADVLPALQDGRALSIYGFDSRLAPLAAGESLAGLRASGHETAIGDALKNAWAAHRGQPLAGVLLASEGQSNAGDDPRKVAAQLGKEGVPIVALAVGTEQGPSNARLIDLEASPVVFVRDPTEVSALVESRGLQGRTGVVTIELRQDGGAWSEIGREEIVFGEDAIVKRMTVKFTPDATGQYDFRARVSDAGVELTEADNEVVRSVKVIRQRIRVLLVAGSSSPEVQFLRNALLRDNSLEFASWLQTAGDGYEHVGHRPLRRLPANRQELEHYDVLILFDPDMRALGSAWPDLIARFVGDAGGGLIYVAGEQHSQQLFAGGETSGSDNSWLRALPVATDPGLYQSAAEVRLSARDTYNLELTPEGAGDSVFRFAADPNKNREVLASLPGMYWHFPVTRAKPGATVLARHGDPRMRNNFGRHVLLATHRYGPGRTVFIGFDSTYRWRYLHEEYFDGFWARLIDRVGRGKVLGGRYPFTLSTDKSAYRAGDRVTLRAQMVASSDEPVVATQLRGELEAPGEQAMPIELEPVVQQPGVLETTFTAETPGAYLARIVPSSGGAGETDSALRPATLNFRVEPPRQEVDRPTLDRALLDDLATASGGQVILLADYRRLPDAFKVKEVQRTLEYRDELWDAPLLFGGFVLLLTIEWVLRKRWRMA